MERARIAFDANRRPRLKRIIGWLRWKLHIKPHIKPANDGQDDGWWPRHNPETSEVIAILVQYPVGLDADGEPMGNTVDFAVPPVERIGRGLLG